MDLHPTPPTLLERLRGAGDEAAWRRFVHLYTPLLYYWARCRGETEHDAADLVQEVYVTLLQTLPTFQYDRDGKFRSWLRTVMLNKLRDRKRREARAEIAVAQASQMRPEASKPDAADDVWEAEYLQRLTNRALRLMQTDFAPATWQACWETVVQGRSPAEVARQLGISENAVYLAKCRVLRRLRQELKELLE